MPEMTFDWDGLINLLAKHLYSEKKVFLREIIQNAHDAIVKRRYAQSGFGGRIDVRVNVAESWIEFQDDGIGMNEDDLVQFLATVGRGQTYEVKKKKEIEGLIGQFGIGFLSAFVVAHRVELWTRKLGESAGWFWVNTGSRQYDIGECEIGEPGTRVRVHVNRDDAGLLHEREISETVRRYADMLLVPIHLNHSPVAVNTGRMPWELAVGDEAAQAVQCLAYLETHMQEPVLEVIPFKLQGPVKAQGALYISSARVVVQDAPRRVEVYLNRMFVCQNVPGILPEWASFVNGVINTSDLQPNAARDSILRDEAFEQLRSELGELIIRHLEGLRDNDPERFSRILEYHALRIRGACLAYDEFLHKFTDLIEWETNGKETDEFTKGLRPETLTLPQILDRLPGEAGRPKRLLCFNTANADHFFEMANSAGTLVVDASGIFEMELLEKITKRRPAEFRLVRVDREDADELFRRVADATHPVAELARGMTSYVQPGSSRLEVSAREFEPKSLPAIVRDGEGAADRERALRIYNDPRHTRDARELAEAIIKQPPKSMKLTINAANEIVQRLAALDLNNQSVKHLMTELYNSSFLSSGRMTVHNAKILHADYLRLMERSLGYLENEAELNARSEALAERERQLEGDDEPAPAFVTFFMITPFSERYDPLRKAVKRVVEERWKCRLFLASDRRYEDRILDSVAAHMRRADAFIAEITDANPNVMFELGAAFADRRERPILQLRLEAAGKAEGLPADLSGMIYAAYPDPDACPESVLDDTLDAEMKKDERVSRLLDSDRERYLSPRRLREITGDRVTQDSFERLSVKLPTYERWNDATVDDLRAAIEDKADREFCGGLLKLVHQVTGDHSA